MNRSAIQDILRGLPVEQVSVLYWKCQGLNYEKIGEKLHISHETVTREMAFVYDKLGEILGIDKDTHWRKRKRILEEDVCDALMHLIDGNPENLKKFPQRVAEEPLRPEILAIVLFDQMKDEEEEEVIEGEPVDDIPPPPPPPRQPGLPSGRHQRPDLRPLFIIIAIVLLGVVLFRVLQTPGQVEETPIPNTQTAIVEPPSTVTPNSSATPEVTLTPENSPTPEILPTAVPLPIREDFSQQHSDLWRVIGNPIITEGSPLYVGFSGIVIPNEDDTITMWIGNTAWTDYFVSMRAQARVSGRLLIGVRVKDVHNMIALDCASNTFCRWVIVENGEWDILPAQDFLWPNELTISVEGNTVTAVGRFLSAEPTRMSLVIPPKYEGKFDSGGFLFQLTDTAAVDFIQIDPLP